MSGQTTTFPENYNILKAGTKNLLDRHAPIKKYTHRVCQKSPACMGRSYVEARRKRKRLEKVWKRTRSEQCRQLFIRQRDLCVAMALEKQAAYYRTMIHNAKGGQKSLFKIVNNLLDKNNARRLPAHSDEIQLANDFNNFYINKINKYNSTKYSL